MDSKIIYIMMVSFFLACQSPKKSDTSLDLNNWGDVLEEAKGQSVTMMMWNGDPLINDYMQSYVIPSVKARYDIDLKIVSGQGNQIVNLLMTEIEAGRSQSDIDMMWINGETFYQLRQIKALYGPFSQALPNSRYIDWNNPFISVDFQQPVDGYECPWGNVQMTLIYRADKVKNPPQNLQELERWVQENPGRFTIGNNFTGMTLLKSWLSQFAVGKEAISGAFSEEKYQKYSTQLWEYVNRIKPYLWNKGESFPSSVAQMHRLFASGELLFTMSNNDAEVDNKIAEGIFLESSKAYVPEIGSIQNSHYLGIASRAPHKEGALVVINFLICPEAQYQKYQPGIWGDGTVLSIDSLPPEWQLKFKHTPGRKQAPDRSLIQDRAIMEPAPEYMIRLFEDFRKKIMED